MFCSKTFILSLQLVLLGGMAFAQETKGPPRFEGSRATASSDRAGEETNSQNATGQVFLPSINALTNAAALEAASEEGRNFVKKRNLRSR